MSIAQALLLGTTPDVTQALTASLREVGFAVTAEADPADLLILGPEALEQGLGHWQSWLDRPALCLGLEPGSAAALDWLAAGALDTLALPLDQAIWNARLEQCRLLVNKSQRQRQNLSQLEGELKGYRTIIEREQGVAKGIFSSLLRIEEIAHIQGLRWQLDEQALAQGNLILAAKAPGGNLHLLVGDFPDRTLAASIGALVVAEIFYTMTDKGFELMDIVQELNQRLRRLLPSATVFAVCLAAIDVSGQQAYIWNGGLPPQFLYHSTEARWTALVPDHPPLGLLPNERLNKAMKLVSLEENGRLLLHAHGLLERLDQEPADLLAWLNGQAESGQEEVFEQLLAKTAATADQSHGTRPRHSGIAMLEYQTSQTLQPELDTRPARFFGKGISTRWSYELELDPAGLRAFDPRPMLTQLLVEIQGLQEHREKIYTIIAELYSNALEHGLLELDSQLKSSPEGFAQYYQEREMRLALLEKGQISFRLSHRPQAHGGVLGIEIQDSGRGFDYKKQGIGELRQQGSFGRGIGLVRGLTRTLEYFPPGNRVRISYHWQHS